MSIRLSLGAALAAAVTLAACGGAKDQQSASATDTTQAATPSAAAGGEQTPDAGGQVVKVELLTDEQGNNVFRPAEVTAKKGDVVRFTLVAGVHNVHFLADSNPNLQGLPSAPSDMLQLQGQTFDVKVGAVAGKYYFQCDPHALLGMKGHLTVTQ